MKLISAVTTLVLVGSASAYTISNACSRREMISNVATGTLFGIGAVAVGPSASDALEQCPPKSNNCVRTTWTPPSGTSKDDAIAALRDAINAYPQAGQADVDKGGWSIAEDNLAGSGAARIEYKSSGTGFFAKAFNGGKPFVDDLKLEVEDSGVVQVKSQSRIGDSDLGVNKKRTDFIAASLAAKGWSI
eukprot:CAMPEP_0113939028 /NCGR_PEP_ID=MMETSP1339-20121228/5427_1 /TAXON_ID=94617 /ORGANISM="Fibrocapsa japonica" /LENGTH=188 /DNA_ID=CAMNT_0000942413 /DNA_START=66 /DNA_END=632 /DNA_ORIENTATION=- /assembly_acc=CAM_ASM_000762